MRMILKIKKEASMSGEKFAEWSVWRRLAGVAIVLAPLWTCLLFIDL